ncbi:hypothetical protein [Haloplasma contractile]|uniref:GIY-YIG domain-containing protein n=1 Tax=Haloplasma contractile SSD-17B TaxID=1033810 RepID=U2FI37_9MOLU|nr:hypothetical protein [Haloplasma contractile]ERJ10879.1 hypothetical protein HLPCO_003149 [Haloplasma contractile SSD-17B]
MELLKSITIDKNRADEYELPNVLLDDEFDGVNHDKLIYIYYVKANMISYPNRNGSVVYIGRTVEDNTNGLGRFTHIAPSLKEPYDHKGLNYALSSFYNTGKKLELCIYKVPRIYDCHYIEELLIKYHMNTYGCHPIAQGHDGFHNSPQYLEQIILESKNSDVRQILTVMEK